MKLRSLLLSLSNGIERERYEHQKMMKESFEDGNWALREENRKLKTKIKELKLQHEIKQKRGTP